MTAPLTPLPDSSSTNELPRGYALVRELAASAQSRVVHARWKDSDVVVRITRGAQDGQERLAELAVLGAVGHPGLARLVDHGTLGGDRSFVARTWVNGLDLASWAAARRVSHEGTYARDVGAIVQQLCPALEHLHRRGFVHADLKPTNVIVGPDDRPVITDFGLARVQGGFTDGESVSGTLFAIAPEQLLGGRVDARTDLFSLGVMLHQLMVGRRPSAREFYARFPELPFLEATRTSIGELPEWSRDIVAQLLSNDPTQRPASAADLERVLGGRLGLSIDAASTRGETRLVWPPHRGREPFFAQWIAATKSDWERTAEEGANAQRSADALLPQWWLFPAGDDPEPCLDELRLQLALAGCPVSAVSRSGELTRVRAAGDLDRWSCDVVGGASGAILILPLATGDRLGLRAAEALARTALQRSRFAKDGAHTLLVVGSEHGPPASDVAWRTVEVPQISVAAVAAFMAEHLEDADPTRIEAVATRIANESGGSATRLAVLVQDAVQAGWIVPGRDKPRLRPGPLPERIGSRNVSTSQRKELLPERLRGSRDARRVLATIAVAHEKLTLAALSEHVELSSTELAPVVDFLADARYVSLDRGTDGVVRVAAVAPLERADLEFSEAEWRAFHARRADHLQGAGGTAARVLGHRYRADPTAAVVTEIASEIERLRECGLPELALDLASHIRTHATDAGVDLDVRVIGEIALTWVALGHPDRALEVVRELDGAADAAASALRERVLGHVANLRHEVDAALAHFTAAATIDPSQRGDALVATARVLFESRREGELAELFARVSTGPAGSTSERGLASVDVLWAMSQFRQGHVAEAQARLERGLARARDLGDAGREAGVSINLATLARRRGDLDAALEHFARAEALYEADGRLPGLAQVRALLGGTWRDTGDLVRAERSLISALEIRERLGDSAGADAVRGMLGLSYADRGHVKPALHELCAAASSLRARGRTADAAVLAARATELEARIAPPSRAPVRRAGERTEAQRADEADPRILLCLARTAWFAHDVDAARAAAERAQDLASRLSLAAPLRESRLLLSCLARYGGTTSASTGSSLADDGDLARVAPAVRDDAASLVLLESDLSNPDLATRALALADELRVRGRDDRAARLYLGLATRSREREWSERCRRAADDALARCERGLESDARAALRRALLSFPDPWPSDLDSPTLSPASTEGWDMDIAHLLEINHRLVQQEDLDHLLGVIVESALTVSGAERGFLVLEEHGELKFDKALDSRRGDIAAPDLEVSKSIVHQALQSMQPLRLSNAVDDPLLGAAPSVMSLELRSILCVPFEIGAGLRGVIYIDHRLRQGAFAERAEQLLALLADQAALAILQVRRIEEIRRLNRELNRDVATKESDLRQAHAALRDANLTVPASGLIGTSPAMVAIHRWIERAAPSKLAVLLVGQSGTGKELAARALHSLGPRRERPFISENCAAFPESLIEAELFGYKKGAYTGAGEDRPGMFERANGGTLFLDEIGDLPLGLQAKLLRVLETSEVRRLGESRVQKVDFRLVAATNRDLEEDVRAGTFRADLFYRLDGLRISLPPLAARVEDIPALVDHFLRLDAARSGTKRSMSPAVLARLCRRPWPGNVRELSNEVARLCVLSEGDIVDVDLVRTPGPSLAGMPVSGVHTLAEMERTAIERALTETGGDKRRAADLLGISRAKIYQRIKEWRLEGGRESTDVE